MTFLHASRCLKLWLLLLALGAGAEALAQDITLLRAREGAAAMLRGQFDKAVAAYDEALSNPEIADFIKASIYSDRGVAKWRMKQTREAIEDFNQSIQISPENATVYNNRGNALMDLGHPEEAVKDFDRAISLTPTYGVAYNNRGNANALLGNYKQAYKDYRKAVELLPASAVALNGRGKAHAALLRHHAAIRDFTRAINLNSKYEAAYRNRGESYLKLEQFRQAADDFTQVLSITPDDPDVLLLRAKAYAGDKKYNSAVEDLNKALELKPDLIEASIERGKVFVLVRRYDDAIADFTHAIERDPQNPTPYALRANARMQADPPKPKTETVVAKSDAGTASDASPDAAAAAGETPEPGEAASGDAAAPAEGEQAPAGTAAPIAPTGAEMLPGGVPHMVEPLPEEAASPEPDGTAEGSETAEQTNDQAADPSAGGAAEAGDQASAPEETVAVIVEQPENPAMVDVQQALALAPEDAYALRLRGDIHKAMGLTERAIADYRHALERDPFQSESREALVKLDQEVPAEPSTVLGEPVDGWIVSEVKPGRYVVTNPKYRNFRAELEMFGPGKPKLLDWSLKKDSLAGIGVLRYYAGDVGEGTGQDLVYAAIIDLYGNKVVSFEPYSWGPAEAKWAWQAYSVVVTDPDGHANEIALRKARPRPVARDESGRSRGGRRGGGGGGGPGFFNWFFR